MVENSAGGGGHGWRAASAGGVHWGALGWPWTTMARLGFASDMSTSAASRVFRDYRVTLVSPGILLILPVLLQYGSLF